VVGDEVGPPVHRGPQRQGVDRPTLRPEVPAAPSKVQEVKTRSSGWNYFRDGPARGPIPFDSGPPQIFITR
jgi:hypothetical protein